MTHLPPITPTDAVAIAGVVLLALGVGLRLGPDIAIALVGCLLLVYAVLVAMGERTPEKPQ